MTHKSMVCQSLTPLPPEMNLVSTLSWTKSQNNRVKYTDKLTRVNEVWPVFGKWKSRESNIEVMYFYVLQLCTFDCSLIWRRNTYACTPGLSKSRSTIRSTRPNPCRSPFGYWPNAPTCQATCKYIHPPRPLSSRYLSNPRNMRLSPSLGRQRILHRN